ncbi:MAG: TolC family protein [Bdellovibrionaceae bacterium]|nr:TolC family protein [Pseudobdellovibrionaceae bacterium]MBX3034776.1 TolC family protein [Pseudobdellovibrionaceae bacterium]
MWNPNKCFLVLVLAFAGAAPAGAAETLSLRSEDLKPRLEEKNARVRAQKSREEGALEGSTARSFLPRLELRASQEQFRLGRRPTLSEPSYGAELSVNLYNGGRDALAEETLDKRRERRRAETKLTLSEELRSARESYYRLLFLRDSVAVLQDLARRNQDNAGAAERRVKSGVGLQTDRIEFEMRGVELKQNLERVELDRRNEARLLLRSLGWPETTKLELPETLDHEHDWEKIVEASKPDREMLVRSDLLAAEENELSARRESRGWWPRLDAYAGWNQFNQREEDGAEPEDRRWSVVGVRVTMDLFDGFRQRPETSALRAEALATRLEAEDRRARVGVVLDNEREELRLLHAQIHEADENIRRAERYAGLTQSEYARGVKNSPDVLGATGKVFEMKMRRLEILRDFQVTRGLWLAKMGL